MLILSLSYPWAVIVRRRVRIKLPRKQRTHTFSCDAPLVEEQMVRNLVDAAAIIGEVVAHVRTNPPLSSLPNNAAERGTLSC